MQCNAVDFILQKCNQNSLNMFGSLGKFPSSFNYQGKIGLAAGEPKKVDNSQRANFQDYGESFSPSLSDIERVAMQYLPSVPLFSEFSKCELNIIAGHFIEWIVFDRKALVVQTGQKIKGLYIVLHGELAETEHKTSARRPGDIIGSLSLIKDTISRHDVYAKSRSVKCAYLPKNKFNLLLERLNLENSYVSPRRRGGMKNDSAAINTEKDLYKYIATLKGDLLKVRRRKEYVDLIKIHAEKLFSIPVALFSKEEVQKNASIDTALGLDIDSDQVIKDYLREELVLVNSCAAPMGSHTLFQAAFSMLQTDVEQALDRQYQVPGKYSQDSSKDNLYCLMARGVEGVVWKIMHESSRTIHGGDAYNIVDSIFGKPDDLVITPASALTRPTEICFIGDNGQCFIKSYNSFRACKFCFNGEEPQIWCHFHTTTRKEIRFEIIDSDKGHIKATVVSNTLDILMNSEPFESADDARAALAFRRVLNYGLAFSEVSYSSPIGSDEMSVKLAIPLDALQNNGSIWYSAKDNIPQLRIDGKYKTLSMGAQGGNSETRRLWLPTINQISMSKLVTRNPSCPYEYCVSLQRTLQNADTKTLKNEVNIYVDSVEERDWLAQGLKNTILCAKYCGGASGEAGLSTLASSSYENSRRTFREQKHADTLEQSSEKVNYAYVLDDDCYTINLDIPVHREDNDVEINFMDDVPGRKSSVSVSSSPPSLQKKELPKSKLGTQSWSRSSAVSDASISLGAMSTKKPKLEPEVGPDNTQRSILWADASVQHQLNLANENLEREEIEQKIVQDLSALKKHLDRFELQNRETKPTRASIELTTAFEKTFSLIEGKVQELQKEIQKLV